MVVGGGTTVVLEDCLFSDNVCGKKVGVLGKRCRTRTFCQKGSLSDRREVESGQEIRGCCEVNQFPPLNVLRYVWSIVATAARTSCFSSLFEQSTQACRKCKTTW